VAGLSLYLPGSVVASTGLAYAILLHGIQVIWYLAIGGLAMFTSHVSFAEMMNRPAPPEPEPELAQAEELA